MEQVALELNSILEGTVISKLLSAFGRRFYYPKGIPAQDAEAKKYAKKLNATVGMAYLNHEPVELSPIRAAMPGLTPAEAVAYAPTGGDPELRTRWKAEILKKNPDLNGILMSEPMVVPGLTNGISQLADLFVDPGDPVVVPDMFWENYNLIFEGRREALIVGFPFFTEKGGLNVDGLKGALRANARNGKAVLVVNFPNNPTGYSPTTSEANALVAAIRELASEGLRILVILDDAYFGLFYEQDIFRQSLFTPLAQLHENVLAAKVDGATKEDFAWGFRLAFVTFGGKGLTLEHYDALNLKLMGAIRSSVSNSARPAQSLLLRALGTKGYDEEKATYFASLRERYRKTKEIIASRSVGKALSPLPFNSGYFMCFRYEGDAERLRKHLLMEKGIGTVSLEGRYLRVCYSIVELDELEPLFAAIFEAADELGA